MYGLSDAFTITMLFLTRNGFDKDKETVLQIQKQLARPILNRLLGTAVDTFIQNSTLVFTVFLGRFAHISVLVRAMSSPTIIEETYLYISFLLMCNNKTVQLYQYQLTKQKLFCNINYFLNTGQLQRVKIYGCNSFDAKSLNIRNNGEKLNISDVTSLIPTALRDTHSSLRAIHRSIDYTKNT